MKRRVESLTSSGTASSTSTCSSDLGILPEIVPEEKEFPRSPESLISSAEVEEHKTESVAELSEKEFPQSSNDSVADLRDQVNRFSFNTLSRYFDV